MEMLKLRENSIEESINRINYIFEFQEKMSCQYVLQVDDTEAIKHLLFEYKRVQRENEELKADLHDMTISNEHKKKEWVHKAILNSYISKQKIKDKIEELELEIKEYIETDNTGRFTRENCILTSKVNVLKELLKGE